MLGEIAQSLPAPVPPSVADGWMIFGVCIAVAATIITILDFAVWGWRVRSALWAAMRWLGRAVFEWLRVPWSVPALRKRMDALERGLPRVLVFGGIVWKLSEVDGAAEMFCEPCYNATKQLNTLKLIEVIPVGKSSVIALSLRCPAVSEHLWSFKPNELPIAQHAALAHLQKSH